MNPVVSIIVPVYNVEKYLSQCIESIVAQSYQDLEIILVDDGSTDSSGAIADQYAQKDLRIKVIHKKNAKVSAARNSGLDAATGEWVCFADADDYLEPDYVEYLLTMAVSNDVDIALTTDMYTNYITNQNLNGNVEIYSPESATIKILTYYIPIGVYCKIFKRSFLVSRQIRFIEEIYIGEGFNFNTAAFQRAQKIAVGHRRIYFYRRNNPNSATTKFVPDKWVNGLYAIDRIKQDFVSPTRKMLDAWEYARWHTNSDVVNFILLAKAKKENKDMYKACRRIQRKNAKYALRGEVELPFRERLRAILMKICPGAMPRLFKLRSKMRKVTFD